MIIARDKKKNNIAEYILYMFQVEDMIRANKLDFQLVDKNIIGTFQVSNEVREEMRIWYRDLIEKMKKEKKQQQGHLQFLHDIMEDLYSLHQELIQSPDELKYIEQYNFAKKNVAELKEKMKITSANIIEIMFDGLYAFLLLRLKKKPITIETAEAISTFSNMLALLSSKYKDLRESNN